MDGGVGFGTTQEFLLERALLPRILSHRECSLFNSCHRSPSIVDATETPPYPDGGLAGKASTGENNFFDCLNLGRGGATIFKIKMLLSSRRLKMPFADFASFWGASRPHFVAQRAPVGHGKHPHAALVGGVLRSRWVS